MFDSECCPDPVCINAVATYAQANVLPLPSIRNTVRDARALARERGSALVSARDVKHALESRQRADVDIRAAFGAKLKKSHQPRQQSYWLAASSDPTSQEPAVSREQQRRRHRAADSYALNLGQSLRYIAAVKGLFLTVGWDSAIVWLPVSDIGHPKSGKFIGEATVVSQK